MRILEARLARWVACLAALVWPAAAAEWPSEFIVGSSGARGQVITVWVPEGVAQFSLGVYDQTDDGEAAPAAPTSFSLRAPDGSEVLKLAQPVRGDWADYSVETAGRWGVWQLRVSAGRPADAKTRLTNTFRVRTGDEVELSLLLPPAPRYNYFRRVPDGPTVHRWYLQVPAVDRLRVHLLRSAKPELHQISLIAPAGVAAEQTQGGLPRGGTEWLLATGANLSGIWEVAVEGASEPYRLGLEQRVRLFAAPPRLTPMPEAVALTTVSTPGDQPVAARVSVACPQAAGENTAVYTNRDGQGVLYALPGLTYAVTAMRGFEYGTATAEVTAGAPCRLAIERVLTRPAGWYCGDNHTHSIWSDGNDTPAQMVEASRANGLDWLVLSDHGQGTSMPHIEHSQTEALAHAEPGVFEVIRGHEYTLSPYHANVLGGMLLHPTNVPLQEVIDAALAADRPEEPLLIHLNHPTWSGTAKAPELALECERLPLLELWNGPEPGGIQLWFQLLNRGLGTFAVTNTDSHNRVGSPPGGRRTYAWLGDAPLNSVNILRAMQAGRSYLSRGALLDFTVNGEMSGGTVTANELAIQVATDSARPIDRVELIHNGEVIQTVAAAGQTSVRQAWTLPAEPGWYLVQVLEANQPTPLAMCNPVFVKRP